MRNFVIATALAAAGLLGTAGTADAQSTSNYSAGGSAVPAVTGGYSSGYVVLYDPNVYNPYAYNPYNYNLNVYNPYAYNPYNYNLNVYNPYNYNPNVYNPYAYTTYRVRRYRW